MAGEQPILLQNVPTIVQTHNIVDDAFQRPTENVGGVYSYQAIAPGTELRAELRLRESLVDKLNQKRQDWVNLLEDTYHLGRANKDDYGLVQVNTVQQPTPIPSAGDRTQPDPPQPPLESYALLTYFLTFVREGGSPEGGGSGETVKLSLSFIDINS